MAQAVFDEHPIEQYLRGKCQATGRQPRLVDVGLDAGETREPMPGTTTELELELDPMAFTELSLDDDEELEEWRPRFVIQLYEVCCDYLKGNSA
jgi:hypothetical protein